jgi:hypothetical protein
MPNMWRLSHGARDFEKRSGSASSAGIGGPCFALPVECVVNNELLFQNLAVVQTQLAKTVCEPAQAFAGGMGIARMRVSRADDFTEQNQRGVS